MAPNQAGTKLVPATARSRPHCILDAAGAQCLTRSVGPHDCHEPTNNEMLIYLDANIVQYCPDEEDFILGGRGSSTERRGNAQH